MIQVDLTPVCNILSFRSLPWFGDIPAGDAVLAGVPFCIRQQIVFTHGYVADGKAGFYPGLPDRLRVAVGVKAKYLAFLHTAIFQSNAFRWNNHEAVAAEYRIRFEDGCIERLPVTINTNVRNFGSEETDGLSYESAARVGDRGPPLSVCCWENPFPEKAIAHLEAISARETTTSLALFAVTALDRRPWQEGIFRTAGEIQTASRRARIARWREQAKAQIAPILAEKNMTLDDLETLSVNTSILKVEDDWELVNALDLDRPELGEVKAARSKGDIEGARRALARHLRARKDGYRTVLQPHVPKADYDLTDADDLCRNRFNLSGWTCDYGDAKIDFYAVPERIKPEPHWYFTHYLQYVGPSLAEAYTATGDEKYARRLFNHILDVIRQCPAEDADGVGDNDYFYPAADADGDGWPDRAGQTQAWDLTTSACRLSLWMRCVAQCMDSEYLTDDFLLAFFRSTLEQIRHAFTQATAMMDIRTNHATFMAGKLIECGVCFPEFKCAGEWKRMGVRMLEAFYGPFWEGGMVYPDGATYESHTGSYGAGMIRELREPIRQLEQVSEAVPPLLRTALEKMYEWLLYITTPLRHASPISMVYHAHYGFDVEALCREAHAETGREDLLFIGTEGKAGSRPAYVSYPFTSRMPCYGGVYAMRSGWDRDALYLCAKMGPMHYRHCANQGHFVIDACGSELVTGPGYAHEDGEFHRYTDKYMCGDGMSYNTISVGGIGQKQGNREKYALKPLDNTWLTNHLFDFLEGHYDFRPQGIDVGHTRSILFIKPDYWLVIDRLTGEGGAVHDFRMKYQLHKDLVTEQDGNRLYARNPETGVSLHVCQLDEASSLEVVKGQKTPRIEGWLAVAEHAWPAPAAVYQKTAGLPTGFETLFYPLPEGESAVITAARTDAMIEIQIERYRGSVRDLIFLPSFTSDEIGFDGKLAWVRRDDRGLVSAAVIDGKSLRLGPEDLDLTSSRNATLCVNRAEDGRHEVYADLMNYPGIQAVLNGRKFALDPGNTKTLAVYGVRG